MTDHPSTIKGGGNPRDDVDWDDYATLHVKGEGAGVLSGFRSVRSGTLLELVRFVASLPESEQGDYVIQKAGDHLLQAGEIVGLARRDDYPA